MGQQNCKLLCGCGGSIIQQNLELNIFSRNPVGWQILTKIVLQT
jgi:hypothetical protein